MAYEIRTTSEEWVRLAQRLEALDPGTYYLSGDDESTFVRVYIDGRIEWYSNYLLHREDGPAVIFTNGLREWYRKGIRRYPDQCSVSE